MTAIDVLKSRNETFAREFAQGDMPPLPKLGTLILTCIDARVDPAHVLGVELGDAVVFRNNGGRVTHAFLEEVATLSMMVARLTGAEEASFNIVLMQHTKCGARVFADPAFQQLVQARTGIDVSGSAVVDHPTDLQTDINRLRDTAHLPGGITVAAMVYDVETGKVEQMAPAMSLADLRASEA